jgi:hypothetical protein
MSPEQVEKIFSDNKEIKVKLQEVLNNTISNEIHMANILKLETLKNVHIYCKINNLSGQFTGPAVEKYIRIKKNMTKNSASDSNGDLQETAPYVVYTTEEDAERGRGITESDYSTFKCEELKAECRRLGLRVGGCKNELIDRLMQALLERRTGINKELKASNGGTEHNKFNFVQIRMNHQCEYIFTAYYISPENIDNLGELFIFKLTKTDIKPIIFKYGGYAHRTIKELGKKTIEDLDDIDNMKEYALRPKYGDDCWKELLKFRVDEI